MFLSLFISLWGLLLVYWAFELNVQFIFFDLFPNKNILIVYSDQRYQV